MSIFHNVFLARRLLQLFSLLFFTKEVADHSHQPATTTLKLRKTLAEEELNTALNETDEDPPERKENPADVLRLSEPDSSSYQVFSSDNMIQPKEASSVLKQKRSRVGPCYTGNFQTVRLASGGLAAFPISRKVSLTGCASSLLSNQQNETLCAASLTTVLVSGDDGTNHLRAFAQSCSCAA